MKKRRNSIANALELRLFSNKPLIYNLVIEINGTAIKICTGCNRNERKYNIT